MTFPLYLHAERFVVLGRLLLLKEPNIKAPPAAAAPGPAIGLGSNRTLWHTLLHSTRYSRPLLLAVLLLKKLIPIETQRYKAHEHTRPMSVSVDCALLIKHDIAAAAAAAASTTAAVLP